ncbi:DUF3108 domain-containing protein [Winogradskyella immobilis]|uniref:DUF3108 domain-containing protein n=1 Tax=Winogradskyella immobilis TaxID=2816852 RepID=A0ABS8EN16_9FLAO|nr:DUF3108 domain-containing protein [Winogradskyella immobilis]MCC1484252.1 DUF3108 domain-containing protein [Winogradskyella immobilis]MCG0016344.1 DUF3108 domain-containing protein [Winogradskyella immobilis]
MKQSIFFIVLLFSISINSQNKTIAPGEKLVFTASYNISGLLTDIAKVTMETSEVKTSKSTLMRLKCSAATFSSFDGFFKVRDLYESYVSPKTLTPYLYKRDIDEGGYYKFMQYTYSPKSKTVKSLKRKKNSKGEFWEEKNTLNIGGSTKDIVATLYNIRNLDIDKASPGDTQKFTVLFDNEETTISLKYIGKESISTKLGRKECYKLAVSVNKSIKGSNALKDSNSNLLWLTADANKIPVLAKFKIPVGNGELKIASASGLKH